VIILEFFSGDFVFHRPEMPEIIIFPLFQKPIVELLGSVLIQMDTIPILSNFLLEG